MREIKFKAWDLVKKEWFCHSFYVHESGTRIVDCNEFHHEIGTEVIVIQFTDFKNKKGVELYQGCIIHYTKHKGYLLESFIGEVIWMKEAGCWGYRTFGYDYAFNSADEIQFDIIDHIEVIGNIYENPELIS